MNWQSAAPLPRGARFPLTPWAARGRRTHAKSLHTPSRQRFAAANPDRRLANHSANHLSSPLEGDPFHLSQSPSSLRQDRTSFKASRRIFKHRLRRNG